MSTKSGALSSVSRFMTHAILYRHVQAFIKALSLSDSQVIDGDILSPTSPRSPPPPISLDGSTGLQPSTWKYGPDNGILSGGMQTGKARVEKLTATSDFAVSSSMSTQEGMCSLGQADGHPKAHSSTCFEVQTPDRNIKRKANTHSTKTGSNLARLSRDGHTT